MTPFGFPKTFLCFRVKIRIRVKVYLYRTRKRPRVGGGREGLV